MDKKLPESESFIKPKENTGALPLKKREELTPVDLLLDVVEILVVEAL